MAKCDECRSADTLPLAGDKVCCLACGHTGDAAPSPTAVPEAAPGDDEKDK